LVDVTAARKRSLWYGATRLAAASLAAPARAAFAAAERHYAAMHKRLLRRNIRVHAIAYPAAAADFAHAGAVSFQRAAAAPLRCGWDRVGVLAYGSLLAGWSRGLLDEDDARWYAHRALSVLARALGPRASAFVGL